MRVLALFLGLGLVSAWAADDLPAGEEREMFIKACSSCHPPMRVVKTRFSKKFWGSVVDDMVSRGAEVSEEETNAIVSYLSRHFGKPVNVNTSTAKQIQEGLSFKAAEAEALVQYRTANGALKSYEDLLKVPGLNAKLLDEQKKNFEF